MNAIEDKAIINQIKETHKTDSKGNYVKRRYVEISNEDGSLKVIFNDKYNDLPHIIQKLDEVTDLNAEVDVNLNIFLLSRQTRFDDSFKTKVKKELDEEGIDVE